MELYRPTYAKIHLDRLMANFRHLLSLQKGQEFICPMIKANAYGHGDVAVAKALEKENCRFVGVSSVEEGVRLREHYIRASILVFGFHSKQAVEAMLAHSLTPVISSFEQLEHFVSQAKMKTLVHLKFNTGMNRLGFSIHDIEKIKTELFKNSNLELEGVCTHFHSGVNICEEGGSAQGQLRTFKAVQGKFKDSSLFFHVYNSSSIVSIYKQKKTFDYGSRPGLLVYGIDPETNMSLKPLVSPVMELRSKIVALHKVKLGEVVSYAGTWQAKKDSLIGIVPAGYADGVCRNLSNKGKVLVKGQFVPVRGLVCMDYVMIDLTEVSMEAANFLSEEVVFIGQQGEQQISVEDIASWTGRISYEVMTGVSERVPRIYGEE